MKTRIAFNTSSVCENLLHFAKDIKATYDETCGEIIMKVPDHHGSGIITGVDFESGVSLFTLNCRLEHPLIFEINTDKNQPLRFNFCAEGSLRHMSENGDIDYTINQFEGSIASPSKEGTEYFYLPSKEVLSICSLRINRKNYLELIKCDIEEAPRPLREAFKDVDATKRFLYTGYYSLAIAECAKSIDNSESEGLARKTFLESRALELLSLQLKQYEDDQKSKGKRMVIRKAEFEMIVNAKQYLIENLADPPTIAALARIVGLNQQKLKEGFKSTTNMTINKFVQNERLKLAAALIRGQDLDINDAAGRVGYSNKSFFAKKFKEKFGVLPKHYAQRARKRLVNAQNQ